MFCLRRHIMWVYKKITQNSHFSYVWAFDCKDQVAKSGEDAIYDSYAFRKFMNIDFMKEQVPDATTLLKFRHLLEENHLGEEFFKAINRVMEATGHIMHGGTIVDATIISAPSSTKNAEKKRDPEMH